MGAGWALLFRCGGFCRKGKLTVDVIDVVDADLRVEPGFPAPRQLIPDTVSKRQGLR